MDALCVPTNGEYVYITMSHDFHLILGLNLIFPGAGTDEAGGGGVI